MKIYTFSELKESKLIFDRKAPPFGIIVTAIVLFFVIALLIFAGFAERTYVVKASGIVTSENKVNVMNSVGGTIKEVCVAEGQSVNQGDVLFTIDTIEVDLQIAQLQGNIDYFQTKIDNYYALISYINLYDVGQESTLTIPFSAEGNQSAFYYYAKKFADYVSGNEQSIIDGLKNDFVLQYYSAVEEYAAQVNQYNSQKTAYEESLNSYTITAHNAGVMHFSAAVTAGTVIQAGTLVGTISPATAESLYFETVVSATERSKIAVGNEVEIAITGVLQIEFGTLNGTITEIGSDSLQTESGEVYYKVKIKTESTLLKDKKGNTVALTNGMLAESRIKYDETTWLKWVIEQIGVKLR